MAGPTATGAHRIAIIDDELMFADALAALLDDQPEFEVVGKGRAADEAVAIAREQRPDVMLLDYHLPGGPGHTLVQRIVALSPLTRVVMLTCDASADARAHSLGSGAHGFVTKDVSLDHVVAAIAKVSATV